MPWDNRDIDEFFGCRRPSHADYPERVLRTDIWSKDDSVWGEVLFLHYQGIRSSVESAHLDSDSASREGIEEGNLSPSRIPRLIHFVWLGPDPIPPHPGLSKSEEEQNESDFCCDGNSWNGTMQSWATHHSESNDWRVQIWTDESVAELRNSQPPLTNDAAFAYALSTENYGMASDILRLELLHRFGGLYIDIDYYALGSVEKLHRCFDFYCGCSNTGCVEINNGLIGSKPNHPLLTKMMKEINSWFEKGNFHVGEEEQELNPSSESVSFLASFLDDASTSALQRAGGLQHQPSDSDIIKYTGPGLITRAVCEALARNENGSIIDEEINGLVAVLPSSVFHPFPNIMRGKLAKGASFTDELKRFVVPMKTKALHLWGCSWQN